MATRARGAPRECPVPLRRGGVCKSTSRAGYPCCPTHWRQIPPGLRTAVLAAWGRANELHTDVAWAQYFQARGVALAAVTP